MGPFLGPSLFNFNINDVPNLLSNLFTLYDDDSKLFGKVVTSSDLQFIQKDLNILILGTWADTWLLSFNADKCQLIHFANHNLDQQYHLQGNPLTVVVFQERNLGVVVDHQLKFSTHIKPV